MTWTFIIVIVLTEQATPYIFILILLMETNKNELYPINTPRIIR